MTFQTRHRHWDPISLVLTDVLQTWALLQGTGVWFIVFVQPFAEAP